MSNKKTAFAVRGGSRKVHPLAATGVKVPGIRKPLDTAATPITAPSHGTNLYRR